MFKNEREWAKAMLAGRMFTDDKGFIYKFSIGTLPTHMPFVEIIRISGKPDEHRALQTAWDKFAEVEEIWSLDDVEYGTKVLVSNDIKGKWEEHNFIRFNSAGMMVCSVDSQLCELSDVQERCWEYWKILYGKRRNRKNFNNDGREHI